MISITKTNLETDLMTGSLGGHFLQNNNHFNANSSGNGIIFIMAGFSFVLTWSENACYFFDSHSRDISEFPSLIGTSNLTQFMKCKNKLERLTLHNQVICLNATKFST